MAGRILGVGGAARRVVLRSAPGAAGAVALAACGADAGLPGQQPGAPPQTVVWGNYVAPSDARAQHLLESWRQAEQATGVKIEVFDDSARGLWEKRQAEFAAAAVPVDIMKNQVNWVVGGGLKGMFADHAEYLKRDRVDTKQLYQAEFTSWAWKGKQWGIPFATGGEVLFYNRKLFDQRGVKPPSKDWTYDEFLDACRRLTDPSSNRWALTVVENGLYYIGGTFIRNFGGKVMSDAKDRALYGDDARSLQGTQLNADLHTRYGFVPPAEARAAVPAGKQPIEVELVAMEISGIHRHTNIRAAIGAEQMEIVPPPRGPAAQTAAMAGNAWSILSTSKVKDAAWKVLRWVELTREGMLSPQIKAIAWPPLIAAADAPEWKDQFKGTRIAEATKVWETGGHPILVAPDATDLWALMDAGAPPLNKAFLGEQSVTDALRESARLANEVIARRPPEWR